MMVSACVCVRFTTREGDGVMLGQVFIHTAAGECLEKGEPLPVSSGNALHVGPVQLEYQTDASISYEPIEQTANKGSPPKEEKQAPKQQPGQQPKK